MWTEIRHALRLHTRNKSFTAVALMTLSLGIGLNTAIFGLVYGLALAPLPYEDIGRLVEVSETTPEREPRPVSLPDFRDWNLNARSFQGLAAYQDSQFVLVGAGEPAEVSGAKVTDDFFELLRVRPAIGRTFESDDVDANRAVVILADQLWQRRFGSSPAVLGQTIVLDGVGHSIIGVMPAAVSYPRRGGIDLWTLLRKEDVPPSRADRQLGVVGRLSENASFEQARDDLGRIASEIGNDSPDTNKGWGVRIRLLKDRLVPEDLQLVLAIFSAGVTFVLLIACLNLSSLLLARGSSRSREVAIRTSLGSTRFGLIRQFLLESLVLSAAGGAGGIVVANWGMNLLKQIAPSGAARLSEVSLNPWVLLYALAICLLATIGFGLIPAFKNSNLDLTAALKTGAHSTPDRSRKRLLSILVAAEIAAATVLLAGGLLVTRSFRELLAVDPGFDMNGIAIARLALPAYKYSGPGQRIAFLDAAIERIRSIPGVSFVSATDGMPLGGGSNLTRINITGVTQADRITYIGRRVITPGYFDTLGVSLLRGRDFTPADAQGSAPVAIVNQAMRDRFWPNDDVAGRAFTVAAGTASEVVVTIVGVAVNANDRTLDEPVGPQIFLPYKQNVSSQMIVLARSGGDVAQVIGPMRESIQLLDRNQPAPELQSLRAAMEISQLEGPRSGMAVLGAMSIFALALAGIGIYGVVRYTTSQRTREVGIRIALGASTRDIVRLVLLETAKPIVAGGLLGLAGAAALNRAMSSLLFGVTPADPLVLAATLIVLLGVACAAFFGPVRSAAKTDPVITLRSE